jgi:hypothetical protein
MDKTRWIAIAAVGLGMLSYDHSGTAPSGPGVSVKAAIAATPTARRSGPPPSGTAIYHWSNVQTTGPAACVFFAGPVHRATRRSYGRGSGTWTFSGRRARFELGGAVEFSGTVRRGRVSVRNVERASLDGNPYTFTETITGKMDAAGRFRGTYRYSDCRTDGAERCPGPCTIHATLTGSP